MPLRTRASQDPTGGPSADPRGVSYATDHLWDFWHRYPSMRRVVWFT